MRQLIKINELSNSFCWQQSEKIAVLCEPLFKRFGINYFDYSRFYNDDTCISFFTQPDYVGYFTQDKNYQPPIEFLKPGKYLWHQYIPPELLQHIQQRFDHYYGLTVVKDHGTYTELINFSADITNAKILDLFINKWDYLQLFIAYFRDAIKPLLTKAQHQRIILPEHVLYDKPYEQIEAEDIKAFVDDISSTKKIRANQQPIFINKQLIAASQQELACLQYLIQGMSAKETAKILKLSPRTVELYLTKLCQKANVKNKLTLVACVHSDGLQTLSTC